MEKADFVQIENCHFTKNYCFKTYGGGACIREVDSLYVRNCLFNYNTAYYVVQWWAGGEGGGMAIMHGLGYSSYAIIENNRFFNNKTVGGVLYDSYYHADIIGNTICNNYEEPLFTNPTLGVGLDYDALNADWTLLDDSPCVNTGTPDTNGLSLPLDDLAGNPRVFGNRIDMGALENQNVYVKIKNAPVSEDIKLYPNPGTNQLYIQLNSEMKDCFFDLFNGQGSIIMHRRIENTNSMFMTDYLPTGVYHYRIYNQNKVFKNSSWVKL
ncbi:MAG: right-handed parallel beta-helix repeat-containing protein [Bacteroidetes bacterium]|nr:right-handed parallel beta-helix repeat-containing protein [Bacteroidota bacterium]